jgi:hypothetical protein
VSGVTGGHADSHRKRNTTMKRLLLTAAALALALCAPVAAQARMDEITAANFNERYAAVAAINETMRDRIAAAYGRTTRAGFWPKGQ